MQTFTRIFYIDGRYRPLDLSEKISWALYHFPLLSGAALFAFLLGLFVIGFLGYQLHNVARNVTTNETFKWKEWQYDEARIKRAAAPLRDATAPPPPRPFPRRVFDMVLCMGVWKRLGLVKETRARRAPLVRPKLPANPFSRGSMVRNFLEVLRPGSIDRAAGAENKRA